MTAPQFQQPPQPLSIADVVALTGASAPAAPHAQRLVKGIAALDDAGPGDLTYFDQPKYAASFARTRAGVYLATSDVVATPADTLVLTVRDPYRAFVAVARALYPDAMRPSPFFVGEGVSQGATIHPAARLEADVRVDPGVVIGPYAEIGAGTIVGAGAVIGPHVRIGRGCVIGACVTIGHALIGDRVILHPGVRIGQDGFGYALEQGRHRKVPQTGRVIIQDDVEIGANTTVDRGGIRDTVIGEGTKIDNLVQIAHNVTIGRHCLIVSQCGLSGSVTLGDYAVLGGQVGIADHRSIGEGAQVGAKSGVMQDIPAGERWLGVPAMRGRAYLRLMASMRGAKGAEKRKAGPET